MSETKLRPPSLITWRVFCAVEIPAAVRTQIAHHQSRLQALIPHAKAAWTQEQNIHLTVKFLGEISLTAVENLSAAAARTVRGFCAFSIEVGHTGVFPKRGTPNLLWIGITDSEGRLRDLSLKFEEECAAEGFAREGRLYHPHLTIARLRSSEGSKDLATAHKEMDFKPSQVLVKELVVIRSELNNSGPRYSVISSHSLGVR